MNEIKKEVYRQAEARGWSGDDVWCVVNEAIKADRETQALALEGMKKPCVICAEKGVVRIHDTKENKTWQQAADHLRSQKIK